MALSINIVKSSLNSDGTVMNLSDDTGAYNVSTNPGGYGTPNPDRNQVAIFLLAYNKRSDGDVSLSIASYNKTTATTWAVTLNKDGWQQVNAYGLQLYDVNTEFSISELVYNSGTDEIWKILTKSGSGPYTYTHSVATTADLEDTNNVIAYKSTLNTLTLVNYDKCLFKANKKYYDDLGADSPALAVMDLNFNTYLKLDSYGKAIAYDFAAGNYTNAEEMVEQAEKICDCLTDDCDC